MRHETTIFSFSKRVEFDEVEGTLFLAELAAASLHGEDRVRLQANVALRHGARAIEVDTTRAVGRTLSLVLAGYLRREFGDGGVRVERATRIAGPLPGPVSGASLGARRGPKAVPA